MPDLFLIAHKVHGEPAFDVATQMECPICQGVNGEAPQLPESDCSECDGLGYWWIIPTSGHRAYPYWHEGLYEFSFNEGMPNISNMPDSLPDHYNTRASPSRPAIDIRSLVPPVKIQRRF